MESFKKYRSRRRHQWRPGSLATTLFTALTFTSGAWAVNAPLSDFEIEGDIQVGGAGAPFSITAPGVDWSARTDPLYQSDDEDCLGAVCAALSYYNAAVDCMAGVTVCDNPNEPGDAVYAQDGLKSEGDMSTFTQGDKENDWTNQTPVDAGDPTGTQQSQTPWHIVPGSVQPNKDDLFNIYAYSLISGLQADVVLAFERTNNNGSSHVDFELNRLPWVPCAYQPGGGAPTETCPIRVEGDILISYEITQGGAVSGIQFFKWNLPGGDSIDGHQDCTGYLAPGGNQTAPCPWQQVTFDPNNVFSTLNPVPIPAGAWGSKLPDGTPTDTIGEFGFFETFLDFDALGFGPGCPGFATASLKSRASGSSVTSALSDLGGPFPLDLNNCAQITIVKDADPADGTDFTFNPSSNLNGDANFYLDDASPDDADGISDTIVFGDLDPSAIAGDYTVQELLPSGWDLDSIVCEDDNGGSFVGSTSSDTATITLQPEQEVTCTFTNEGKGSIKIVKQTNPDGAPGSFSFTGKDPANGDLAWGSLGDNGSTLLSDLPAGTYTAIEADPTSAGFKLTDITCTGDVSGGTDSTKDLGTRTATFNLDPGEDLVCTFTNSTGAIKVTKTAKNYTGGGVVAQAGVDFTVNGTTIATNSSGEACFDGLIPGTTYSVTESVPTGYQAAGANPKMVEVTAGATCSLGTPNGVSFVNDPLSQIQVIFTSLAGSGVTAASIVCSDGSAPIAAVSENGNPDPALDDSNETFTNLVEGTYTCTIVIDP